MYFDYPVQIPFLPGKVYKRTHTNGVTYIEYEFDRVYNSEKKYNTPKRTTIGKMLDQNPEKMYPNPSFYKYFPDEIPLEEDPSRSACLRIGGYILIKKIIHDYKIDALLSDIIGRDSGLLMDLAAYSVISEDNAGQYYPDYAFCHPLFTKDMRVYSDSKVSDFFENITIDQSIDFLNRWNADRNTDEKIYISYDSSNRTCQAGDIEMAEMGNPKDGADKAIVNYAVGYDLTNREPLFYDDYPGSIPDVVQLQCMVETAYGYGYRNIGFILDRGNFSKKNIQFMDRHGYAFVMMVKGCKDLVREMITQVRGTFEDRRAYAIPKYHVEGITVRRGLYADDERERYFHIYYSSSRHATEKRRLEDKLERMQKKMKKMEFRAWKMPQEYLEYFDPIYYHEGEEDEVFVGATERTAVIDRETSLGGYFAIVTSEEMTAKQALTLYKSRDSSEKLFRADKTFLGNRTARIGSGESYEAKMFVLFIAMIIRNRIYTCLADEMERNETKANYMTVPAALKELEKIEMIKRTDGRYRMPYAITATQKAILKAFGIKGEHIKKEAEKIADQLEAVEQVNNDPSKPQKED